MKASLLVLGAVILFAMSGGAMARESRAACPVAGVYPFIDLANSRDKLPADIAKQLTQLGLSASRNGCAVSVTCVAPRGAAKSDYIFRWQQCHAARQGLSAYVRGTQERARIVENIARYDVTLRSGQHDYLARTVYVTLK